MKLIKNVLSYLYMKEYVKEARYNESLDILLTKFFSQPVEIKNSLFAIEFHTEDCTVVVDVGFFSARGWNKWKVFSDGKEKIYNDARPSWNTLARIYTDVYLRKWNAISI